MSFLRITLAALFALSFIGCTKKSNNSGKKILKSSLGDDVKTMDPALAYDSISLTVMPLAVESLFQYAYLERPYKLEPLVAEAMPTISNNGLRYTVKIKQGVFFHKSDAFTGKRELVAEDFLYAWKRMSLPSIASPGTWIFDGKVKGYEDFRKKLKDAKDKNAFLKTKVEGFTAVDKYTIQIDLVKPYPQLSHVLAMGFGGPVAHEVVEKHGHEHLIQNMVGTGPYILERFVRGSKVVLKKNPDYRKEVFPNIPKSGFGKASASYVGKALPFLDEIQFSIMKESQPRWLNFLAGKIDISGIPKDNFDQAISDATGLSEDLKKKGIRLHEYTPAVNFWLEYNMKDPVVGKNKKLRQAISHAIDFKEFNKKFLNGRGEQISGLVTLGFEGYQKLENEIPKFDLEKAKKLLAEAGFPDGKGLPVITYDVRGSGTSSRQMAEFYQVSLKKIGIELKIIPNSFPGFIEKSRKGNLQFSIGGWQADYPDPENFLLLLAKESLPPGPNSGQYVNPEFEKLYKQISEMSPSAERVKLIHMAEQIVREDHVRSLSYQIRRYALYYEYVKNYYPTGLIKNSSKYIDVAK